MIIQEVQCLKEQHLKDKRQLAKLTEKVDALEGKKRFDPSRAFQSKENVLVVDPLKEGYFFSILPLSLLRFCLIKLFLTWVHIMIIVFAIISSFCYRVLRKLSLIDR